MRQFNSRASLIKANPTLEILFEGSMNDVAGVKRTLCAGGCANDSPSPFMNPVGPAHGVPMAVDGMA